MKKKRVLIMASILVICSLCKMAVAQDHGFGLGVVLGEPTGVSGKLWIGDRSALDFGLGLSVGGDRLSYKGNSTWTRVHLHADYLYHFFDIIHTVGLRMPLYFGTGPRVNFGGSYDGSFGWRGVAGVDWLIKKLPVDVFAEVAPVIQVGHQTGFALEGGLGLRYFF